MKVLLREGSGLKITDRCSTGPVGKYHLECKARSASICELIGIETDSILAFIGEGGDSLYSQ